MSGVGDKPYHFGLLNRSSVLYFNLNFQIQLFNIQKMPYEDDFGKSKTVSKFENSAIQYSKDAL
jgi:hypothetical protein